ncbi:MaoC/PaaZ C-terminal domain-containing protein [Gandjariella thermophila]|uniref:3-alpha,7-alpha,12-alpha-trihydroxy-5-beta-choles t-24-enoyl-CoA hydratase n=1 Tax=Gandjariella thermophila TaxID=1931992 RepID=A0A4D4J155_9PSEU|nr:MaoC/PaaZ C-terminal domain-containing protein [Gandjariella thermophila]GDY29134.1 3-alpha,7-alpha,12-alpha-trihydroxy-5-beta-choles t-24-enoyl-CoA hydratase [Gandjariella thermophila]
MPIDPSVAIGAELPEVEFSWTASDVLLYHLGLGAGADPEDPRELRYVYERDLQVLPTFGVVAPTFGATEPPRVSFPGVDIDLASVLHGEQGITVHQPLPVAGSARARIRIADIHDKGKAAVIVQESEAVDGAGNPLFTTRSSIFARGEGGFGGHRGPSGSTTLPDRDPDAELLSPTLPQQALLYRLCGDRNPLHADPDFAAAAGFPRPILHGLCSYGVVCKALVDGLLKGDTARVAGFSARFAGVVYPGETLRTRVWESDDRILLTTSVVERDDAPVLADAVLTIH